jgi:protein involved in polysaccharide export with SLBB domain
MSIDKCRLPLKDPRLLLLVVFLTGLLGCQSAQTYNPLSPKVVGAEVPGNQNEMVLAAGDVIDIKFPYASQFNERYSIRPDGKLELQLIGEVKAAGKTLSQFRDELVALYSVKNPDDLTISLLSSYERRVYVSGEVNKPGPIEIPGSITAFEAVMHAGGFNMTTAEIKNVLVIRRQQNGELQVSSLNFKDYLSNTPGKSLFLEPRDVVFVPRTNIANANQWVQQHFYIFFAPLFGVAHNATTF